MNSAPAVLDIEDPQALIAYLRATGRILPDESPTVQVLAGGVSNRTVFVERATGEAWVLKQALSKLRVAVEWFSSPERVAREALGIQWLTQLAPPDTIPPLVFFDSDYFLLAMQAVPPPHTNWRTMLLHGQLKTDHVRQFGHLLGNIHRHASERRDEVEPVFQDRSFFESLRVEPYYAYTAAQVAASANFYAALIDETRRTQLSLVHGDYSPKNILVRNERLILLDHEVIHWGDPAFDLGFSLTHLLSKAHHVTNLRREFGSAARLYWKEYSKALGSVGWEKDLEPRAVRHTLGCLLARVSGRSPHDYWTPTEAERQRQTVVKLMQRRIETVDQLVDSFLFELGE